MTNEKNQWKNSDELTKDLNMYQESAISVSTTELKGTIMSSVRTHQALTEHANSDE